MGMKTLLIKSTCITIYSVESLNFRLWFNDWHDVLAVDYTKTTQMMAKKKEQVKITHKIC